MPASARRARAVATSGRQLGRVIEVDVHPQRMELTQHRHQLRRDALRHEDRHTAADPDDLDVLDGPQPAQDILQHLRREQQRVAAAQQHVTDRRCGGDVRDLPIVIAPAELRAGVADDAAARAVAAVAGALSRHQHQHPIGIAVHQARHRAVAVFVQRIDHHAVECDQLLAGGDHLAADRAVRIIRVDQRREIRGDVHPEVMAADPLDLLPGSG